tara:strand:+ start:360 stop:1538 length:1179 start_codon:yes stop_codon:yes gene_type:complete
MYKNLITIVISSIIGLFLVYLFGILYFYTNLNNNDTNQQYQFKDIESLNFHKKYSAQLHHLKGVVGDADKKNLKPENYLFSVVNPFNKNKNKILIQGDSYVETLTYYSEQYNLLKKFSLENNVGLINGGIASYSPSLMSLQLDILEKDFGIYPNIVVAYFDQSDVGDELCRYKEKRIFNKNGNLIKIKEETYSGNIFNFTKIYKHSEIILSESSNIHKAVKLINFNISYRFLKQKHKLSDTFKRAKKYGWKNRRSPKCYWPDIEKPLIENKKNEIDYFKDRVTDYLSKLSEKKHIQKIFVVTFPHRANLFPVKNKLDQKIYYNVSVKKIVDDISKDFNNFSHINFEKETKGKEEYLYNNAYIDHDPHLKKEFHYNLFAKTILNNLKKYLDRN